MTYAAIRFEVGDGVATVTLARPDKLNAIDRAMREDLRRALREAARDDAVRALILTGAGRAFSAGQDVGESVMDAGDDGRGIGRLLSEDYNRIILALATLEKPVVAAVNGVAAGMGVSLVLASDIAIAARSARFIQAFIGLGLGPDGGASFFLPRAAGRARAAAQLMLGDPVSAEEAAAWGMIWRVVDD
ncbi:MAG: enoyl-CoA hydratase-related protein, partial [Alphaproteobacteria bacterium]